AEDRGAVFFGVQQAGKRKRRGFGQRRIARCAGHALPRAVGAARLRAFRSTQYAKSTEKKMLTIWGRTNSINVQKVLWCCGELGLQYERIDAGMQFGVNNTPEYRALNPNGLVPTIDYDGFVLWESHAIVRFLALKHGRGTLWPEDERGVADADRWMEWYSTTMWNNLRPIFWTLVR